MTTEAPAKTENIEIFYTPKDSQGIKVSLWITHKTKPGSPDIDGKVGDLRVAAYIRNGPKGPFLSFIDSTKPKDANGHYTQFGIGNIVVVKGGRAKLAIKKSDDGETVWAETSRKAPQDLLVAMGLNLEIQAQKTAEGGTSEGSKPAARAAAPAPAPAPSQQPVTGGFSDMDDDIPF